MRLTAVYLLYIFENNGVVIRFLEDHPPKLLGALGPVRCDFKYIMLLVTCFQYGCQAVLF
jgi:hypothetical protein